MRYLADIPGCSATVELDPGGFLSGAKLYVNDAPAREGVRRREYLLPGENGKQLVARIKPQFLDPVPVLKVDGQTIRVVPFFSWEWILIALPFVLMFYMSWLAIPISLLVAMGNAALLRTRWPIWVRILLPILFGLLVVLNGLNIHRRWMMAIGSLVRG